jgi:PAS domain S-box-containing protein
MGDLNVRLAAYLAVVALPLGAGAWAFADFAAESEYRRSDSRLEAATGRAIDRFQNVLDRAEVEATSLAASPGLQRALARSDVRVLRGFRRRHPTASFAIRGGPLIGRAAPGSPRRSVNVFVGARPVGRVTVAVPLDAALVERLTTGTALESGALTLVVRRGRVVAPPRASGALRIPTGSVWKVRFAGRDYRALAATLIRDRPRTSLAVLEPNDRIEAVATDVRRRILAVGFSVLLAVLLIAYAVAPGLSRGRVFRRQRADAARVLERLGEGVFFVDGRGIVRLWNSAAERITGLPAEAVQGRAGDEVIPGWNVLKGRIPVTRGEGNAKRSPRAETVALRIGERETWISISGVAFAEGTVYAFRDETEAYRLERAKRDFVATVSHELRTPVASVFGAAQTLRARSELPEDARRQLFDVVIEESTHLARLVDQILLAERLDSGPLEVVAEDFDGLELAREVVDAARPRLSPTQSLELTAPPSLPRVRADRERLRQVLVNLVDNAVKYSPHGGQINLELKAPNGCVRFTVRDEGVGIPATEQAVVFEKFHRLDANMLTGVGGTGLGLYICRALVEQMKGTITIASTPGQGSSFTVELPTAGAETSS